MNKHLKKIDEKKETMNFVFDLIWCLTKSKTYFMTNLGLIFILQALKFWFFKKDVTSHRRLW